MVEMPCNYKNLTSYHCACGRDFHGNVIYVIRTLNAMYLSLFLDKAPPPLALRPKMSFGQQNLVTYIHNICKWHLGGGGGVVDAKEDNIQLKPLTSGGKYSKYTKASTVQIYKIVSCRRD